MEPYSVNIDRLRETLQQSDAIVIGAGSGLSTSAGFTYAGARFEHYFGDFQSKYPITDMYAGGFYLFPTLEEFWGWWARQIWINRYQHQTAPKPAYEELLNLVRDKDYFVLTTNVDHQFQLAGFDKHRLFYTQGDYGLWQCSEPCHQKTYENKEAVVQMLLSEGFLKAEHGQYVVTDPQCWRTSIDSSLVPTCPVCGRPMAMNLRCDDTFVQDEGWYVANHRYQDFIRRHQDMSVVYLELGVGMNTPGIIKYPFWQMTWHNPKATYVCLNNQPVAVPREIAAQSVCIKQDILASLQTLDMALQ